MNLDPVEELVAGVAWEKLRDDVHDMAAAHELTSLEPRLLLGAAFTWVELTQDQADPNHDESRKKMGRRLVGAGLSGCPDMRADQSA
jgi:hypothetical protein